MTIKETEDGSHRDAGCEIAGIVRWIEPRDGLGLGSEQIPRLIAIYVMLVKARRAGGVVWFNDRTDARIDLLGPREQVRH